MTRASELKNFDRDELMISLKDHRKELLALRFRAATGQLNDVSGIKKLKREVARILTILRESELDIVHTKPMQRLTPKGKTQAPPKAEKEVIQGDDDALSQEVVGQDELHVDDEAETDEVVNEEGEE